MHRCSKVTKILRIHFNGLGGQRGKLYIPCQKLTQVSLRGRGGWGRGGGRARLTLHKVTKKGVLFRQLQLARVRVAVTPVPYISKQRRKVVTLVMCVPFDFWMNALFKTNLQYGFAKCSIDLSTISATLSVLPEKRMLVGGPRAHFQNSGW